jgi:hypothetical protein
LQAIDKGLVVLNARVNEEKVLSGHLASGYKESRRGALRLR